MRFFSSLFWKPWFWTPVGKDQCEQTINYVKMRLAEALVNECDLKDDYSSVFSFLGRYYELSAEPKVHGALKMIEAYGGTYKPLTDLEYHAVTTNRLGVITELARKADKLHPEFYKQEEVFKSKGKKQYFN